MAYENRGIGYMRRKLAIKQNRVNLRYKYYEMKNLTRVLGLSIPPQMRTWTMAMGWCAHAVDDLADRMIFREFREDLLGMNEIFERNNPDVLFDSAVLSALISACAFVYISPDEDGFPRLQVIDGGNATGVIDEITGLLQEGYAVLQRNDSGEAVLEAHFTAEETSFYSHGRLTRTDENPVGYPLLVPIIHRPDAKRPFGHSRISRACMNIQDKAVNVVLRSEISAEFYSFPQKYVTGLSTDADLAESWKASMSSFLMITKDDDGEQPKFGQFTQQSMEPHLAHLKMFASEFAGETGLTLDDLGFPSDNPSSAEAIRAGHEALRLRARKAQRTFGSGFLNVGFLAACLRDEYRYRREAVFMTKPVWEPVFEPDAAGIGLIGDGAIKINQAVPGFITAETMRDLTGIEAGE